MSLSPQDAAELASDLLDRGFAVAGESSSVNFRWAGSSLTTNGATSGTDLTVVAIAPSGGVGTLAVSGELDQQGVRDLVARATEAAAAAPPGEDQGELVTPEQAASSPVPWSASRPDVSLEGVADFTTRLGNLFDQVKERTYALYGFADQHLNATWLASTTGVRLRHDQPSGSVACTARGRDGQTSTWAGRQSTQLADIDVDAMGRELETKLGWSLTKREAKLGRQPVILSPSALSDLLIVAHWDMSGRDAREGRSAYSNGAGTKLEDRVAPKGVSLVSDPSDPRMPCAPFHIATVNGSMQSVFDTGLPVRRVSWINDGVLSQLVETRAGAAANGQSFAPLGDNLIFDAGVDQSFEELVAKTESALLINTLWYIREVDPTTMLLTGLTRDGVYQIEDGHIVGEVGNFRWNDSPLSVLEHIVDASRPELCLPREWGDWWERALVSAVRVDGFNLSSVSQAI